MKYRVTQLTPTESGTYNEGGNILPDMLNGEPCPTTLDDMLSWLSDEGYATADGYAGWGTVVQHQETGELLSITEDPEQSVTIARTPANLKTAYHILLYLQGDEDIVASRPDPVIVVDATGRLLFTNRICGVGDDETVLASGDISARCGDGWDTATAEDVIDWLSDE